METITNLLLLQQAATAATVTISIAVRLTGGQGKPAVNGGSTVSYAVAIVNKKIFPYKTFRTPVH